MQTCWNKEKVFTYEKSSTHTGLLWDTNMSLDWNEHRDKDKDDKSKILEELSQ